MPDRIDISVKGKMIKVPALQAAGATVVSEGRLLKIGRVFDEYWLERALLPSYDLLIAELKGRKDRPDIFTFTQRVPDVEPAYSYHSEPDNCAVLSLSTYNGWMQKTLPPPTRKNIRASIKRGITVRACSYDDDYVRGIMSIYNETPFRAGGRPFWHFGKDFAAVKAENATYSERSTYLAAFAGDEMVGYLKMVWDSHTAAIMQILSKLSARESRPNNALMAEAVRLCCDRNIKYLLYEKFDYGRKTGDSLTVFKRNHGFSRMDVPRYYVPLTMRGAVALRLRLHKRLADIVPERMAAPLRDLRARWYRMARPVLAPN